MKPWIAALLALLLLLALAALWLYASARPLATVWTVERAQMNLHDHTLSAAAASSSWQPLDQRVLAQQREVYWLRFRLRAPDAQDDAQLGVWLALRAASEVYLDGQLLTRNGVVGNSAQTEVPGRVDWYAALPLPPERSTVELMIRASSQQLQSGFASAGAHVIIGPYSNLLEWRFWRWLVAALAYGAIVVASIYFFAVRGGVRMRDRSSTLLLLLGAIGLLLPWVEAWRFLWGYSYPWHAPRLWALQSLHTMAALLLPLYLSHHLRVNWSRWWIGLWMASYVLAWWLAEGADARMWLVQAIGLGASLACIARAPRDRDWPITLSLLLGTLALAVVGAPFFLDGLYFIALAVLMVALLLAHARELVFASERAAQLEAERARLRAELLRRVMQPHWLLNTLTAMQELIEREPSRASRMVEHLADELQRLRALAEHSLIPLDDELALCQNHLVLRELAHALDYSLTIKGDTAHIVLPPGVLHALIENAFTHAGAKACAETGFELSVTREGDETQLQLRSALARQPKNGSGTGSAFIEASLQAQFPARWRLRQYEQNQRWIGEMAWSCGS